MIKRYSMIFKGFVLLLVVIIYFFANILFTDRIYFLSSNINNTSFFYTSQTQMLLRALPSKNIYAILANAEIAKKYLVENNYYLCNYHFNSVISNKSCKYFLKSYIRIIKLQINLYYNRISYGTYLIKIRDLVINDHDFKNIIKLYIIFALPRQKQYLNFLVTDTSSSFQLKRFIYVVNPST